MIPDRILKEMTDGQLMKRHTDAVAAKIWDDAAQIRAEERRRLTALAFKGRNGVDGRDLVTPNAGLWIETPEETIRRRYRAARSGNVPRATWNQHGLQFVFEAHERSGALMVIRMDQLRLCLDQSAEIAIQQALEFVARYAPKPEPKVTGRRWADGSTRDDLGNITVPWKPDTNHALWLQTHCPGCGVGEVYFCNDGCPRIEIEARKRGMTVSEFKAEGDRLMLGLPGPIARSIPLTGPDDDVDEDERRDKRFFKRIVAAFDQAGIYECQQDGLVVLLPDGDMAWMEIADGSFPARMVALSDQVEPDVLRLDYRSFPAEASTEQDAADELVRMLADYMKRIIAANPNSTKLVQYVPGASRTTHKLFISWRIRPTIMEVAEGKWKARACFVAQWADKKFEPAHPLLKKTAEFDLGGRKFTQVEVDLGMSDRCEHCGLPNFDTHECPSPELRKLWADREIFVSIQAERDARKTAKPDLPRCGYCKAVFETDRLGWAHVEKCGPAWNKAAFASEHVASALRTERALDFDRGHHDTILTTPAPHMRLA